MAQLPKPEAGLPEGSGRVGWLAGQLCGMNATETGGQMLYLYSAAKNSGHAGAITFWHGGPSTTCQRLLNVKQNGEISAEE